MKTECFIVGGGPSLSSFDWSLLNNKITIAINNAYQVLPQASICYFTDNDWFSTHQISLLQHPGIKVKGSLPQHHIHHPKVKEYTLTQVSGLASNGNLAHGYNSAHAAPNLAYTLGFKTIYLLGIDMGYTGGVSHWHDTTNHRVDNELVYRQMITAFEETAIELVSRGIEVINLNPQSKLKCFKMMEYNEILKG